MPSNNLRTSVHRAALMGVMIIAGACASDRTAAPNAHPQPGLDVLLPAMAFWGMREGLMQGGALAFAEAAYDARYGLESCAYASGSARFVCGPRAPWTFAYTLRDAGGHPQSAVDGTTASITLDFSLSAARPYSVDNQSTMTLQGPGTDHLVMNGTARSVGVIIYVTPQGDSMATVGVTRETASDVELPSLAAMPVFPKSGSITTDEIITTRFTTYTHVDSIRQVIRFDGTPIAKLTFSSALTPAQLCTVDLVVGTKQCATR